MVKKSRDTGYAAWKCPDCDSWVFTLPNLHVVVCRMYKENKEMRLSAQRYYDSLQMQPTDDAGQKQKKKGRKKK